VYIYSHLTETSTVVPSSALNSTRILQLYKDEASLPQKYHKMRCQ